MKLILKPANANLLKNNLLLPALVHMIAQKHAIETQLPLLQQETFHQDYLELHLLTETPHTDEMTEHLKNKLTSMLDVFFGMADEEVSISWED